MPRVHGTAAGAAMVLRAFWLSALPWAGGLQLELAEGPPMKDCRPADEDLHIVFSTGCNKFQHWQAEVLLSSARYQGQCGKMTRIVAGCDQHSGPSDKATFPTHAAGVVSREDLFKSIYPDLNVHIAPSVAEAADFPWFNKPWSFHHWLLNRSADVKERAIAILDPDEFFLQPLTQRAEHGPSGPFAILNDYPERLRHQVTGVAQPGWAVAQKYGLGAGMLDRFNQREICPGGEASPCAKITQEEAMLYFSVGPPYIMHNEDFRKVMPTWWELMGPVYRHLSDILADMNAYAFAAMHHNVRHVTNTNYMVSNEDETREREAWDLVDSIESMSCHDPEKALQARKRPGFLHAAGHFKACTGGDHIEHPDESCPQEGSELWNFHKGHVPATILDCDNPLIMPPPDDLFNKQVAAGNLRGKRSAFLICHTTFLINRAVLDYKRKFCEPGFNAKKCTRLVIVTNGPNGQTISTSREMINPFGYPFARVDAECNDH